MKGDTEGVTRWGVEFRRSIRKEHHPRSFDRHYHRGARHGYCHADSRAPTQAGAHRRYVYGYARGLWEHVRQSRPHRKRWGLVLVKEFALPCGCTINAMPRGYFQSASECRYWHGVNHHLRRAFIRLIQAYPKTGPLAARILGGERVQAQG